MASEDLNDPPSPPSNWFPDQYDDNSGRLAAHLTNYTLDLHRPSAQRLVVTFEPAGGNPGRPDRTRPGWAARWLERQGFAVLAVKPMRTDWYRKPDLHAFLRQLQREGFFDRFSQTIFYGASMGGYAALAFSSLVPGSIVLAYSPQSSLDPALSAWDPRFKDARTEDWTSDFADGADCGTAARVVVIYDPHNLADRGHVARLPPHNLMTLRFPAGGHMVVARLAEMKALGDVFLQVAAGTMTVQRFAAIARGRRTLMQYWLVLSRFARSWDMAQRCVDHAEQIAPGHRAVRFYRAYIAHRWQRWDEAVPLLTAALEQSPRDSFLHEALAESHAGIAARYASAGLVLKPANHRLRRLLAGIAPVEASHPVAALRAGRARALASLRRGGVILNLWAADWLWIADLA